jgi:hypothetical protein
VADREHPEVVLAAGRPSSNPPHEMADDTLARNGGKSKRLGQHAPRPAAEKRP